MRDPRGVLRLREDGVVRALHAPLASDDFLFHPLARQFVAEEKLVDFSTSSLGSIESPRLPFVSHPDEWADSQLFDAAALTLEICDRLASVSHELKDASAWNVIFDGCRPVFCDHLSFQRIGGPQWWAFGQFVRHFVLPLSVSRWRGMPSSEVFRVHRDGLQPSRARELHGLHRFFTRQWPLMMAAKESNARADRRTATPYHARLVQFLRWQMATLKPRQIPHGGWASYEATRSHYGEASIRQKRSVISTWIENVRPRWVLDLGCNLGEFSMLCAQHGAKVIAADFDPNCIDALYRAQRGNRSIHPVVANLDDLAGGRGWAGWEIPGLPARLAGLSDVVLALGLVHHLAITHAIPLNEVVAFLRQCTQRYVMVECISESDPLVIHLCQQRGRQAAEFSLAGQLACFGQEFRVLESIELEGTERRLLLLENFTKQAR